MDGLPEMKNKLEYYEKEVRRLEAKLTQQKVSYEKQINDLKGTVEEEALDSAANNFVDNLFKSANNMATQESIVEDSKTLQRKATQLQR